MEEDWKITLERKLRIAEAEGHDVCYKCGTIDPKRCKISYCNNCLKCYGHSDGECWWCCSDDDD